MLSRHPRLCHAVCYFHADKDPTRLRCADSSNEPLLASNADKRAASSFLHDKTSESAYSQPNSDK